MPRSGELQARIRQGVGIIRDGHLVVEPPAPLAVSTEKVINQALDDLAKCPQLPRHRILKCVVPLRPAIFLADRRGGLQERPPCSQGRSDLGTQLSGKRSNRLFDIYFSAVHLLGPEQVWELLENVLTDHGHGLLTSFVPARRTRSRNMTSSDGDGVQQLVGCAWSSARPEPQLAHLLSKPGSAMLATSSGSSPA